MSGIDYATSDGLALVAAVRARRAAAREVCDIALARIAARDPDVNAFTRVLTEQARAAAAAVDATIAAGGDPGPLAGLPFAVKNLFDVAGLTTLAGSNKMPCGFCSVSNFQSLRALPMCSVKQLPVSMILSA